MHFVSILVKYVCTLLRARVQLTACRVVTESKARDGTAVFDTRYRGYQLDEPGATGPYMAAIETGDWSEFGRGAGGQGGLRAGQGRLYLGRSPGDTSVLPRFSKGQGINFQKRHFQRCVR